MDDIRLVVEQEIAALKQYEAKYRKALKAIDESGDAQYLDTLTRLESRMFTIMAWLSILSVEEYLVIMECVVNKKSLSSTVRTYKQCFHALPENQEETVCLLRERGLSKIVSHLSKEHDDANSLYRSLE